MVFKNSNYVSKAVGEIRRSEVPVEVFFFVFITLVYNLPCGGQPSTHWGY